MVDVAAAGADDEMIPAEREEVIRRVRALDLTSCDFAGDAGCAYPECWRCYSPLRPENLRALAANITIASMLCRAWRLCRDDSTWWPGCNFASDEVR